MPCVLCVRFRPGGLSGVSGVCHTPPPLEYGNVMAQHIPIEVMADGIDWRSLEHLLKLLLSLSPPQNWLVVQAIRIKPMGLMLKRVLSRHPSRNRKPEQQINGNNKNWVWQRTMLFSSMYYLITTWTQKRVVRCPNIWDSTDEEILRGLKSECQQTEKDFCIYRWPKLTTRDINDCMYNCHSTTPACYNVNPFLKCITVNWSINKE